MAKVVEISSKSFPKSKSWVSSFLRGEGFSPKVQTPIFWTGDGLECFNLVCNASGVSVQPLTLAGFEREKAASNYPVIFVFT